MTFDPVAFVNLLLSSLIGVASGWLIAHWYWKRSAPVERILKELKGALPRYLHPLRFPQFHAPSARRIELDPGTPADMDVPRLVSAVFSHHPVRPGAQVELLFNILDRGRNFDNPSGIRIEDHLGRRVVAHFAWLGYATATIDATPLEQPGKGRITVRLRDSAGKENLQTLDFDFINPEGNP
jgi:hypothetical protein